MFTLKRTLFQPQKLLQRILIPAKVKNINAVENANLCGKICDMRTLLKYAKNAATCQICGNRIFA